MGCPWDYLSLAAPPFPFSCRWLSLCPPPSSLTSPPPPPRSRPRPRPRRHPQWIWTGFHIGGVGTFILGFFSSDSGYWRLSLVAFAWLVAFGGIFYGLAQFYRRRAALREGRLEPEAWENPHAPAIVVAMFTVVISSVLVFAVATA